ncbi:hypothetical protein D3C78_1557250 [compost metagenome]
MVGNEQRGIAKLQVDVDQDHILAFLRRQVVGKIGRQEGRAAAALARDKGKHLALLARGILQIALFFDPYQRQMQRIAANGGGQHLAHAGTHRPQQHFRRLTAGQ